MTRRAESLVHCGRNGPGLRARVAAKAGVRGAAKVVAKVAVRAGARVVGAGGGMGAMVRGVLVRRRARRG